jgi:hypothetical protein
MAKTLPPESAEQRAAAEKAVAHLNEFRARWRPLGDPAPQKPGVPTVFSAALAGYAAGKTAIEEVSGVRSVPMGQPTHAAKPVDCHGCGAPLTFTNFGREATCGWCKREYRR